MSASSNPSLPSDVCLLLRADAEQCWLHREVIPVLRQVEASEHLPEEEIAAALAYLEAMWDEARVRARATDAARTGLGSADEEDRNLSDRADHYHVAVRTLREVVASKVAPLVANLANDAQSDASSANGCAPKAA
jgi:hypothetical protein